MQAQQLLSSIPQLFASTQSSEAATGAAISAVIAALKVIAPTVTVRLQLSCVCD